MSGRFGEESLVERPKSSGMRVFLNRITGKRSRSDDVQAQIQSFAEAPPIVKAFVNTLTAEKLSNLLAWFLYYDVVKFPDSPSRWYRHIDSMEMRGWIALGSFLEQGTNYGFELVVLDSICDRLQLDKASCHSCLIHLADHQCMTWTTVALILRNAKQHQKTEVECFQRLQRKLQSLRTLAGRLKPTPATVFSSWKLEIIRRLDDFLGIVVVPRLISLHGGTRRPVGCSAEIERELVFLFEMMQQERQVSLIRYGIYPDPCLVLSDSSSSGSTEGQDIPVLSQEILEEESELERTFSTASLLDQNRRLRAKVMQLENDKRKLEASNVRLARKAGKVTRGQPQGYIAPLTPVAGEAGPSRGRRASGEHPPSAPAPTCDRDSLPSVRSWNSDSIDGSVGTPPSAVRRRTAPAMTSSSPLVSKEALVMDPSAPKSSNFGHVFEGFSTRSPSLSLMKPTSETQTPPSSPPTFVGPGQSNGHGRYSVHRKLIGNSTFDSNGSTLVEKLPRNKGIPNLYEASGYGPYKSLDSSPPKGRTSRSASNSSRDSSATSSEPSPANSIADYRARQVNLDEVQQPVEPYVKRSGSNPAPGIISRRLSDVILRQQNIKAEHRRSWSLGSTLKKEGIDGTGKLEFSPSTNF
jgi:hypothetical protein